MTVQSLHTVEEKTRKYSVLRYSLAMAETACFLVFLFFLVCSGAASGLSAAMEAAMPSISSQARPYLFGPLVMLAAQAVYTIIFFPLLFYRSFLLEHQFGLSRQTVKDWAGDQLRAGLLGFLIASICLEVFYFLAASSPRFWWLWLGVFWTAAQFVLAFLAPRLILPLFFIYKPFTRVHLKERIFGLAAKMGLPLFTISEINLSAKTSKANACLVGWGALRRVVLGDTLSRDYSDDEIMVILAHEFAHQRMLHVPKLIVLQSLLLLAVFWAVSLFGPPVSALVRPEAVPLLIFAAAVFSLAAGPLHNALSRRFERQADAAAIAATGDRDAFISAMEKLASQNLSDRDPGWLVKVFFFDHPPVNQRIAAAKAADVQPAC